MTKQRGQPRRRQFSEVEREMVRRHYADSRTADLAAALGLSVEQVQRLANALGVHKDVAVIATMARERMADPSHPGRAHWIKPGSAPANKGKRMPPGWSPGRMAETQFKPGCRGNKWVPIGTHRIRDGYLQRKVSDLPKASPHLKWRCVHELVWIEAHGPVPAGHVVVFRPGCRTTHLARITLDAVELVSRSELMARNTIQNLPEPMKAVTRLRAALTRQINKRARTEEGSA
ncbi:HNH endonuclease [Piscinibacter sakaiensis]|nr:HNH endonuclease [Piscinibacter sakaiensis]